MVEAMAASLRSDLTSPAGAPARPTQFSSPPHGMQHMSNMNSTAQQQQQQQQQQHMRRPLAGALAAAVAAGGPAGGGGGSSIAGMGGVGTAGIVSPAGMPGGIPHAPGQVVGPRGPVGGPFPAVGMSNGVGGNHMAGVHAGGMQQQGVQGGMVQGQAQGGVRPVGPAGGAGGAGGGAASAPGGGNLPGRCHGSVGVITA